MNLLEEIKECFDRCILSKYDGPPSEHPIVYLNSIKNIIGDNKKIPSKILLDRLKKASNALPKRKDDQKVFNEILKEGIGLTVFISDLEEACQAGDYNKMEHEAARLNSVSENGISGLEILVELGLQNFDHFGLFCYHLHRANLFNHNPGVSWNYTRCILNELCKVSLPEPHENNDIKLELNPELYNENISLFIAAYRLSKIDSVRKNGFNREISYWISKQDLASHSENHDKKANSDLIEYSNNGGELFINFAEELIDTPGKIVVLDSLRYLTNHGTPDHLPYIYNQLLKLKK